MNCSVLVRSYSQRRHRSKSIDPPKLFGKRMRVPMKDAKWIFPVVATFLVLSSLAHGILGWKAMRAELARAGASHDIVADLATGWYLGSVAW